MFDGPFTMKAPVIPSSEHLDQMNWKSSKQNKIENKQKKKHKRESNKQNNKEKKNKKTIPKQ